MHDPSSSILLAFLEQYLSDRDAGSLRSLADYQARYPGFDAAIALEFERLGRAASQEDDGPAKLDLNRIGHYRLVKELGRGGQGVVYLAEDERLERKVAVKMLTGLATANTHTLDRFRREAITASRLNHPGICKIYERGEQSKTPFLVMEFVPGDSLASRIRNSDLPPLDVTLECFEQAARALDEAHCAGVIHRDVKPANLMITPEGQPVLLDFGIARLDSDEQTLTLSGTVFGTPAYMSPEQLSGPPGMVDQRTDVYSLGVSLFEALTSERPFQAPTREGLYRQILEEAPPEPRRLNPSISKDLSLILTTAMSKSADLRYQRAVDLAEDLLRVRLGEPIQARPIGPVRRLMLWSGRNRGWAMTFVSAAVILVLTAAIACAYAWRSDRLLVESTQFADKARLDALTAAARGDLCAPLPSRIRGFENWLAAIGSLLGREAEHRIALRQFRRCAIPQTDEDRARDRRYYALEYTNLENLERIFRTEGKLTEQQQEYQRLIRERVSEQYHRTFETPADQARHDVLRDLVTTLKRFRYQEILDSNTVSAVTARLATARRLAARVHGEDAAAWQWCSDYVAGPDSGYGGMTLQPIPGLVPLGIDRDSRLVEFWHVISGERPAWEGRAMGPGRVRLDRTSGAEGLVLVLLPGGEFEMGSHRPDGGPGVYFSEGPVHSVRLDPFFLSKYEVTQGQWARTFRFTFPDRDGFGDPNTPRHPVPNQSWTQVSKACDRWDLALPTEAQWEFACRSGSTTAYHCGADAASLRGYANCRYPASPEGAEMGDTYRGAAPVGSLRANGFGLHDMHGNLGEWCRDGFYPYGAWQARPADGLRGWETGLLRRNCRPGSWDTLPSKLRSAQRGAHLRDYPGRDVGFRPARSIAVVR